MTAPSLDVLLTVGDVEPRVISLRADALGEVDVTVVFPIDGAPGPSR